MVELLKQYLWVLDLFAILLTSFFGAKLTAVYLGQIISAPQKAAKPQVVVSTLAAEPQIAPFEDYKIIMERNIFDSEESTAAPSEGETAPALPSGEPVKTGLAIKVLGVLMLGKGEDSRSSATVQGSSGTDTYAVGDENGFAPNTQLIRVQPDRIIFANAGRLEFAPFGEEEELNIFGPPQEIPTPTTGPTTASLPREVIKSEGEGKFVIDKGEVDNALSNLERLYTEIRAVPNFAGGKVSGMKILSVKQGSLFDKLGLQRGDVLEKINGMELDVKKGLEIFNQLKSERSLTVDLIRQGTKKSFEYDIR